MASQARETTHDDDLDKILNKAFEDIRRRVNSLMVKREKKFLRDMKASSKKPRETHRESKKEYKRSNSSSSDSDKN